MGHSGILAGAEAVRPTPLGVAHRIARLVARRPLPLRAGEVLPRDQHAGAVLDPRDLTSRLPRPTDHVVEIPARTVVGRYDERAFGVPQVLPRDRVELPTRCCDSATPPCS